MTITTARLPMGDHALHVRHLRAAQPQVDQRPTVAFLHDSLGCDSVWRDFPDALVETLGCHGLVYDRRGYGRSSPFGESAREPDYLAVEADSLIRLLAACDIRRAILFGHSDGGSIALLAAARAPGRIAAVVTEGAHVFVEERTLDGIREAREQLRTTDLRERLQRHHGEKTDAVTAAWIETWLQPRFRDWRIDHVLPQITCPTLVLQGVDDEFGTAEQVHAIARGVRGAVAWELIEGAGHTPHREAREVTIALTCTFLRQHVPSISPDTLITGSS